MTYDDDVFAEAMALPEANRGAFLDSACAGDAAKRARVEALLAGLKSVNGFLEQPLGNRASALSAGKPSDKIGRFTLCEKLGEGGCGVVWLAEQVEPIKRRVALKIIKLGMDTQEVVARFEAERQALALMEHPNIARVFDGGATDAGRPYFVMELVRGISLTRYCDEHQFTPARRVALFIDVCGAVAHAHDKGIVHRDLKPANILIASNDDGRPLPKIIDFGVAKATQGRLTDHTIYTSVQQLIGTPSYMSPEQAEMGSVEIDARSDIYSLGVLLYELLTGETPFGGKSGGGAGLNLDDLRRQIRTAEPLRPSARVRAFPDETRSIMARRRGTPHAQLSVTLRGDLDWIVMRCLEKDRTKRYASARALVEDLHRYLQHKPVTARGPTAFYVARKLARRRRSMLLSAVTLCTMTAATWFLARRFGGSGLTPEREKIVTTNAPLSEARRISPEALAATDKSIAVLPLDNRSGEAGSEYFSDGISEELLNVLAKVPGLRVAGRTSSFQFKGRNEALSEIRKKLNVSYVVTGSVQKVGSRARIIATLSRTETGEQIWADGFDTELKDIFGAQQEIAGKIAQHLSLSLGAAPRAKTVDPEAFRLVLEGRHFSNMRTSEGFAQGETRFQRAIKLAADFAEAHAGLARVWLTRWAFHVIDGLPTTTDEFERGEREARRAIELDPTLPDGYAALGYGLLNRGDFAEAERLLQKAVALSSNSAEAYDTLGLLFSCIGRLDASIAAHEKAASIDPLWSLNLQHLARSLFWGGKVHEALEINTRAMELRPDAFIPEHGLQAQILLALGRTDEAVREARFVRDRRELRPRWVFDSLAVRVLLLAGLKEEASDYAAELFVRWPADHYQRGFLLSALDRFDEAIPFLERTTVQAVRYLFWDECWNRSRENSRFQRLMNSLGRQEHFEVARESLSRM